MTNNLHDRKREWEIDPTGPDWETHFDEAATYLTNAAPNWKQVPSWVWKVLALPLSPAPPSNMEEAKIKYTFSNLMDASVEAHENLFNLLSRQYQQRHYDVINRKSSEEYEARQNNSAPRSAYSALQALRDVWGRFDDPMGGHYDIARRILAKHSETETDEARRSLAATLLDHLKSLVRFLPQLPCEDTEQRIIIEHSMARQKYLGLDYANSSKEDLRNWSYIVQQAIEIAVEQGKDPDLYPDFPKEVLPINYNAITEDGILNFDFIFSKFIKQIGSKGQELSSKIKNNSKKRVNAFRSGEAPEGTLWKIWQYNPLGHYRHPRYALILCEVLWLDVVKPRLEREERKRRNPPALSASVAPLVSRSCGWRKGATVMPAPDGGLQVIDSQDINKTILSLAPALEVQNIKSLFGRSLSDDYPDLASLRGQELIAWIVCQVWQRTMDNEPAPRELIIEGGLKKLRELMGLKGNDGAESSTLAAALRAGSGFRLYAPDLEVGGLWTYYLREARRGQPSRLEIGVSSFLAPNYKPHGERLVPIIGTPPLVGRRNDHAAQLAFKFELVLEMVRAGETILDGGVLLPESERERLASLVGLPTSTMNKALDRWTQDGKDGPRMLEREGDRFLLADIDPYRDARAFILEGARRVREGRENGLRSIAARERARRTPRRRR